jgi:S-DNA-T family DNA segregation ATPase FtsK/SpoIIIE
MKLISPTPYRRLNEAGGFVLLALAATLWLSLLSYNPQDPSWNTATGTIRAHNLVGIIGSYLADFLLQSLGLAAFLLPVLTLLLAWKWLRSEAFDAPAAKLAGGLMMTISAAGALALYPGLRLYGGAIHPGGILGILVANVLMDLGNLAGAVIALATTMILALYLITSFSLAHLARRAPRLSVSGGLRSWFGTLRPVRKEKSRNTGDRLIPDPLPPEPSAPSARDEEEEEPAEAPASLDEIPIVPLDEPEVPDDAPPWEPAPPVAPAPPPARGRSGAASAPERAYRTPQTALLNEPPGRNPYDEQELKETAGRIKAKFEEFNVRGNVVQINPGPVVTTFEFKPDAGMKYSRITTLTEDMCLGLQAESIRIERIPGKPTVGIEVPNSKREVISLRQMLESEEFRQSSSYLTISLGKDINGRIRIAALESMPHLLIAGSTGSGKSVMINSMIMSILYKATPDQVRMIMVDPKRLELGLYEGIPHLLTPVITDPKKATNALRNAVLEMERRLRLLAEHGVRNIDQFNRKMEALRAEPLELFPEEDSEPRSPEDLRPLPYILILIDELADLMMLEGHNVEESVTRLAQMARAVGMHLVLATQRPSVDVITGLIKANFPARISFRVATRVDSRTILDRMGAEHLLGKGDMLFLPPGSSQFIRVHGALVTETEINRVVDFWKRQGTPEYDQSYLIAPPSEDGEEPENGEPASDVQDPMYEEALRVVLEMGKASTSTLQRRLRLGYGRAARILDMMHRDGIIGPPDGSKPREVLKRPDWLRETENSLR